MSIEFNNIAAHSGIIQGIEDECGYNPGDISGNTFKMKKWTAAVNRSLDSGFAIIFKAGGTWQFDDKNHTRYNILYTDMIANQADYSFTTDQQGNLILTIDKIFRRQSITSPYQEMTPADVAKDGAVSSFTDGMGTTGVPSMYDKTANGFLCDVIPENNVVDGFMLYIAREGSYFTTADTTKKPGFDGLFHRWCIVEPSLAYARIHLPQNRINNLEKEKAKLEKDIIEWYGQKEHDVTPTLQPRRINPRTGR
jgi:hypothetical protein